MTAGDVAVAITTNRSFKGASFDGVDDYVEIPHAETQLGANLSNGFTISAWVNPRSVGEGTTFAGAIFNKSNGSAAQLGFGLSCGDTTNTFAFILNNGTRRQAANNALVFGTWRHILVTISSAQLINFYVNGVASGTANQDLIQAISTITTTNAPRIGGISLTTDRTFDGSIRSVKMWNRVLTAAEIAQDYAGGEIPEGQILNVPLQTDYNDTALGLTGTNSGTTFHIQEDAVGAVIKTQYAAAGMNLSGAKMMICGLPGGQIISTALQDKA